MSDKYPISIVTGCLGSGKTTLLSNLLKDEEMNDTIVFVNEFGKTGLDHHLLRLVEEQTTLLSGGCICCSKREDIEKELVDLLNKVQKSEIKDFKRIVIETTGLANPAPIMFTILSSPILRHHFYVDCVVTTVDGVNGMLHLEKQEESIQQIVASNRVIITKTDIADTEEIDTLKEQIKKLNPTVEVIDKAEKTIDYKILENGNSSQLTQINAYSNIENESKIESVCVSFTHSLDWSSFGLWLSMLLHSRGEDLLRVKGLLDVGEQGPVILNGVQHIIHPPEHLSKWPDGEHLSHLVFIVRNMQSKEIVKSLKQFQSFLGSDIQQLEFIEEL